MSKSKKAERRTQREEREARGLAKLGSAHACIRKAREIYQNTKNAMHPLIEVLEDTVNNSLKFTPDEKLREATQGNLYRSPTSNRYFIRLTS